MQPPRDPPPVLADLAAVIQTERLVLRPFRDDDVDALWPHVSDPDTPKHMIWAAHESKDVTREFVASQIQALADGSGMNWIIERDGAVLGTVGLVGITRQVQAVRIDRAELGYWLGREARGAGVMTEAARAAVAFGFEALALSKITVGAWVENVASRRVIEKLGFRYIGRRLADAWRDGRWFDCDRWELLASEHADVATTMPISRPRRT